MKFILALLILAIPALGMGLIPPAAAGGAHKTIGLCGGSEKVIFSCSTGRKTISVCQVDLAGSVQYRYGKLGNKPDIALPENPASHQGVVRGMTSFSGGGGAYVAFSNGDTRYVVHDYTSSHGDDVGVDVIRSGQPTISIPCRGQIMGILEQNLPTSIPVE
jgi:hypothetical protein